MRSLIVDDQSAISCRPVGDNRYKLERSAKTCCRTVGDMGGDLCVMVGNLLPMAGNLCAMVGDSPMISTDLLPTDCGPPVIQLLLE